MNRKRGMLVVVVMLVLLSNLTISEEEEATMVSGNTYVSIGGYWTEWGAGQAGDNDCDNDGEGDDREELIDYFGSPNVPSTLEGDGECYFSDVERFMYPPASSGMVKGCWFLVIEEDGSSDWDDGAWSISPIGEQYDLLHSQQPGELRSGFGYNRGGVFEGDAWFGDASCGSDNDAWDCVLDYDFKSSNALICSDDGFWHECNGNEEGKVSWANDNLYNCTLDDLNRPYWKFEGLDKDKDMYIVGKDCADDPASLEAIYPQENCPLLDLFRAEVEDCDPILHSKCAICINPGAPEVCGDEINNDCLVGDDYSSEPEALYDHLDGDTYDDCDKNQAACEQESIYVGEEEAPPEDCVEECVPEGDENYVEDCVECPTAETGKQWNIYGQSFSWIQTGDENEGYCCGYHGIDVDLGLIKTNSPSLGEDGFACLNKDQEHLIGLERSWDDLLAAQEGEEESVRCAGDWCWVSAVGQAKFEVVTIKRPGQKPFDIVSNNKYWFECSANTVNSQNTFLGFEVGVEEVLEDKETSNRFYCYEEGGHYSWAECADDKVSRKNVGVKGRYAGEGLFTLPLGKGEDSLDEVVKEIYGSSVSIVAKWYKPFYGSDFLLDFSGYNYLNFMVKFVADEEGTGIAAKDLTGLPAEVILKIYGPEDEVLFYEGNVLGYTINNPFYNEESWMHVKVPIADDLKGIKSIHIDSLNENHILGIRNIYLSKEGEDVKLCSGRDSRDENSWLQDIDQGNEDQTKIIGKDLCTALYGSNAWLGNDDEIDADAPSANCCGNNEKEYYGGSSAETVKEAESSEETEGEQTEEAEESSEETPTESNRYGCWNSQTVASGETIMDVEFSVAYNEKTYEIEQEPIQLKSVGPVEYNTTGNVVKKFPGCTYSGDLPLEEPFKIICTFEIKEPLAAGSSIWMEDKNHDNEKAEVIFYDLITGGEVGRFDEEPDEFGTNIRSIDAEDVQENWYHTIALVVKLKDGEYYQTTSTPSTAAMPAMKIVHSCNQDMCVYPLPGGPPYFITNSHPDLYELYFVTEDKETLITQSNQKFEELGNVKAKKVAQQVIYYNEGEDEDILPGFYGCQAASFFESNFPLNFNYENKPYCSVIDGLFCSYSVVHESEKERFTTINSWSNEPISWVGYETIEGIEEANISVFYELADLKLKEQTFNPSDRNYSASVLPARNFISNPSFEHKGAGKQVPHWELFKSNVLEENERDYVDGEKLTLPTGNLILKTERIAVPKESALHFSQAAECDNAKAILIDKDGNPTGDGSDLENIDTGQASYLILEFDGPCQIEKPMLQMVDELGPVEYSFKPQAELENFNGRAGAACCPQDYCWNGYACVEPMDKITALTEHIGEGRDYRCVEGEWKRSILKWDWNSDKWGFCEKDSQCFVLSSEFADDENSAETFYEGDYPICVNNSQYVFDHYCSQGGWSSRTKFVASKLVEAYEDEDYVIYCSPYRATLLDYANVENYLGGDLMQQESELQELGEAPQEPEMLATCFSGISDPQGKRLIKDKENACVNNVCVLRYKDGGKVKSAFATTLNRPIDSEKSFLLALNIPQNKVGELCKNTQPGKFTECDLSATELAGDLYYSEELGAVIYAKEGIDMNPSIIDTIVDWLKDLFGIESSLSAESKFITDAKNFRDVYILKNGGKSVRAVKEILPGTKQTLVAEYENFDTPVCDYVENIEVPPELQLELLEETAGMEKLSCTVNDTKQVVQMVAGLDFFWPQLTGRLRVG